METTEKNLSHDESFALIQNMIAIAKNNLTDDGFHFLLWGILVIAASLAQYGLANINYAQNYLPWYFMPAVGIPVAMLYEWRKNKHEKVRTHFDNIFGSLWLGAGITMAIVIFISVANQLSPVPFILGLMGLGTYVSGRILKFSPLVFGSIVLWATAIAAGCVAPINQLLIIAGATFIGYVIPGILLWKGYKAQSHV